MNANNIFKNAGFGEEFAENAFGAEPGGDESDGEDMPDVDEDDNPYSKVPPDKDILKLYANATPHVNAFLANYTDMISKGEIEKVNLRIREHNQRHGLTAGNNKFSILVGVFETLSKN